MKNIYLMVLPQIALITCLFSNLNAKCPTNAVDKAVDDFAYHFSVPACLAPDINNVFLADYTATERADFELQYCDNSFGTALIDIVLIDGRKDLLQHSRDNRTCQKNGFSEDTGNSFDLPKCTNSTSTRVM